MIDYPTGLRSPLNTVVRTQTPTYDTSQPLSGPAYTRKLSTDAPVIYDLTFKFSYPEDAIIFLAWVEVNKIHEGVEFNCPIRTEATGTGAIEAAKTQVVRLVEGDIRSNITELNSGFFTYQARFRARKLVTGLEDYYDIINGGGAYLLQNRESLDKSINLYPPEA